MPNSRLPDAEIERRLPVWHVMTDLFLDTERGAAGLRCILEEEGRPAHPSGG